MKKYILGLLSIWLVFWLSGCGDGLTAVVRFDGFVLEFTTDKAYKRNDLSLSDNQIQTEWMYVEKQDESEWTGYVNSMIIYKYDLWDMELDLDKIIKSNIDTIKNQNETFEIDDQETETFDCGEDEIEWEVLEFELEETELLYFGQYFFIHDKYGYIMSFSSEEKSDRDDFVDSLRTLNCD